MDRDELYYDIAKTQTEEQDKRRQHFDTMATAILGLSGVLVSILAFTASRWIFWSIVPAIGAMIGFCGAAISTIVALWLRKFYFAPQIDVLYEHMDSGKHEGEALSIWAAKQMADAIRRNNNPLANKAKWLRRSYIWLSIEVVALGILGFSIAT